MSVTWSPATAFYATVVSAGAVEHLAKLQDLFLILETGVISRPQLSVAVHVSALRFTTSTAFQKEVKV
jgi:hypothetical protein